MVGPRFDDHRRAASTRVPRRTWVLGLVSGLLTVLPLALARKPLEARKKGKRKKKKKVKLAANPMTGAQEVPSLTGDPIGQGNANFTIEGTKICGVFTLSAATSFTVTGTHIHEGALGVDGPIVVDFGATVGPRVCRNAGGIVNRIKASPADFYANIHTSTHTAGAARGQLQRV
jgi:CHRD domain